MMLHRRTTAVQQVLVRNVGLGSVFIAGDSASLKPRGKVFAVQREIAVFRGDEGNFEHPVYELPIPEPVITGEITIRRWNKHSFIGVQFIEVFSVSSASIMQLGSSGAIDAESRVRNIRQLIEAKPYT